MTASIDNRNEYGYRIIRVHSLTAVGNIYPAVNGVQRINWFMIYHGLHPDIKREVTELAERTVALENVMKRLTA